MAYGIADGLGRLMVEDGPEVRAAIDGLPHAPTRGTDVQCGVPVFLHAGQGGGHGRSSRRIDVTGREAGHGSQSRTLWNVASETAAGSARRGKFAGKRKDKDKVRDQFGGTEMSPVEFPCPRADMLEYSSANSQFQELRQGVEPVVFTGAIALLAPVDGGGAALLAGSTGILNSESGIVTLASILVIVVLRSLPGLRSEPISIENGK